MQLLTTNNYSIQYQCYSDTDDRSWSGTLDFKPDTDYDDLMDWFKVERKDIIEQLSEFPLESRTADDINLEQYWFIIADMSDMKKSIEKMTEEEIGTIVAKTDECSDPWNAIKCQTIVQNAIGFVQWHKHPKRMSEHGREVLKRLTNDDTGVYTLMGVRDGIDITKGDYNTWNLTPKQTEMTA